MNKVFFSRIANSFTELKDSLLDFIYPPHCIVCGRYLSPQEKDICDFCWDSLSILPDPFCPVCKSFLKVPKTKCGICSVEGESALWGNKNIPMVKSLGTFDDHYKSLIHNFKYKRKISLGQRLGERLSENLSLDDRFLDFDFLVPVPLHPARKRERGFNQSEILAEVISKRMNLPVLKRVLKRIKNTKDQTNLNAEQREKNVSGAFSLSSAKDGEQIYGKKIILIDDVITTGATLRGCAEVLREGGAKKVVGATLVVAV
jgi:competence protein ComFC